MLGNRKTTRRRAPAFVAALLALIALGAVVAGVAGAAQVPPTWSIGGQDFSGEETVEWSTANFEFQQQSGSETIKCGGTFSEGSSIAGGDEGSTPLTLLACKLQKAGCKTKPVTLEFHTQLLKVNGVVYEKYTQVEGKSNTWEGNACFAGGKVSGSFAAQVGSEAVESTRSFTAQADEATGATGLTIGAGKWLIRGTVSVSLTGAHKGSKFGAKGVGLAWHVAGESFEEAEITEKEFELTGGKGSSFNITVGESTHLKCTNVSGNGTISKPADGEATLTAGNCVLVGSEKWCHVDPIEMTADIGLTESKGGEAVETFAPHSVPFHVTGVLCPWIGGEEGKLLTGETAFGGVTGGPEAAELSLATSSAYYAEAAFGATAAHIYLDGPFTQELYSGEVFGLW